MASQSSGVSRHDHQVQLTGDRADLVLVAARDDPVGAQAARLIGLVRARGEGSHFVAPGLEKQKADGVKLGRSTGVARALRLDAQASKIDEYLA